MDKYEELYNNACNDEASEQVFTITDDNIADWAVRKIKEEEAEADRIKAIAQKQIEELEDKISKLDEQTRSKTSFLKYKVAEYFRSVPHKETKTQATYKLLSGTLVMKKATTKVAHDDKAVLQWCEDNDLTDFIKVKYELDWTKFKEGVVFNDDGRAYCEATGEEIPGVVLENVGEKFDIKF